MVCKETLSCLMHSALHFQKAKEDKFLVLTVDSWMCDIIHIHDGVNTTNRELDIYSKLKSVA
jgi:hypothetical protein